MVLGVVFVAGILASVTSNVSVSTNASESVNVRVTNKVRSSSETKIQERESLRLEYKQEVDGAREEYRVRLGELKENISVVRDEGKGWRLRTSIQGYITQI